MTLLLPEDPATTDADNDPTPLDVEEIAAPLEEIACEVEETPVAHEPLKLALNLEHKMGLPDFSSVAASMHISGITADHTDDEIAALVERGRVAWGVMGPKVTAQVRAARAEKGWT